MLKAERTLPIDAPPKPVRRNPPPRQSHHKLMIRRAIDDEIRNGMSEEDLRILPPRERKDRLCKHLVNRKLILEADEISDRAFRRYFNGR